MANAFLASASEVLAVLDSGSRWQQVLDREPAERLPVSESRLDDVLEAFADFVDLKSPFTAGHPVRYQETPPPRGRVATP